MIPSLRTGTIVELFDPSDAVAESAVGEVCGLLSEMGYDVRNIVDDVDKTTFVISSHVPLLEAEFVVDKENRVFSLTMLEHLKGSQRQIVARTERPIFQRLIEYKAPLIGALRTEEVDTNDKLAKLGEPAKRMLAWILQQYRANEDVFVFSSRDLSSDMPEDEAVQAIEQLIQHDFLWLDAKRLLVLNRTLADDLHQDRGV